jgi:hypothetical protein
MPAGPPVVTDTHVEFCIADPEEQLEGVGLLQGGGTGSDTRSARVMGQIGLPETRETSMKFRALLAGAAIAVALLSANRQQNSCPFG